MALKTFDHAVAILPPDDGLLDNPCDGVLGRFSENRRDHSAPSFAASCGDLVLSKFAAQDCGLHLPVAEFEIEYRVLGTQSDLPITAYLDRARRGDAEALDELMPIVYQELRGLARSHLRRQRSGLGTESLVHEAYLRLVKANLASRDRAQFFALASKAMRNLIIDNAKRSRRVKRGGDQQRVTVELDEIASAPRQLLASVRRADDLLALDLALKKLESVDPQLIRIVECRFFAGLSVNETAMALELSTATVKRRWAAAKLRLYVDLFDVGDAPSHSDDG